MNYYSGDTLAIWCIICLAVGIILGGMAERYE
jgi:hypothetical protein